jgi:hypothetical protein
MHPVFVQQGFAFSNVARARYMYRHASGYGLRRADAFRDILLSNTRWFVPFVFLMARVE